MASQQITERVLALPEVTQATCVCLYASFGPEVATHTLIARLTRHKGGVVLPRTLPDENRLELHWSDAFPSDCRQGPFGILEPDPLRCKRVIRPEEVDVFIVPGAVFSRDGFRIGYGGGFYDRLLAAAPNAHTIGLAFSIQIVASVPIDPWDRPVKAILTEQGLIGGLS
jgi:5-formyltetrahydrofolate cyclo-ligase